MMEELRERLLANRLILTDDFYAKADQFTRILLNWNKAHNLTGAKNDREVSKHIFDSVFPLSFLDDFSSALDIGTGAGFPGLILAMAKPNARFALVEPLAKRAGFLQFAASTMNIDNAIVINRRAEQAPITMYDLITSRAVSDAKTVYDLALPFMGERTILLLYKGKNTAAEAASINAETVETPHATYLIAKRNV